MEVEEERTGVEVAGVGKDKERGRSREGPGVVEERAMGRTRTKHGWSGD